VFFCFSKKEIRTMAAINTDQKYPNVVLAITDSQGRPGSRGWCAGVGVVERDCAYRLTRGRWHERRGRHRGTGHCTHHRDRLMLTSVRACRS
jgi:hypothetical protein